MNLLTLHHGLYGQRIADNLRLRSPENWQISELELPKALPLIVDDPEEFLPLELPSANLVLHLAETSQAAQLLPGVIRLSGAFVVITPIDNDTWIPPGMRRQLGRELTALGAAVFFPEPFCALAEDLIAAQPDLQPEQQDVLMAFTRHFGRPRLRVIMSDDETISDVIVERGAACGSGFWMVDSADRDRLPGQFQSPREEDWNHYRGGSYVDIPVQLVFVFVTVHITSLIYRS